MSMVSYKMDLLYSPLLTWDGTALQRQEFADNDIKQYQHHVDSQITRSVIIRSLCRIYL